MKQTLVMDKNMEMSTGKRIAQACHASRKAATQATQQQITQWERTGAKKVVLHAPTDQLEQLKNKAEEKDLPSFLVKDAGETELEPGTKTALGIGPGEETQVDHVTGDLEVF